MWVDKPTAILVIHGMGEQTPLETLDAFATTMLPVMETKANGALEKHHRLLSRKTWNENYISVFPQGQRAPSIDIYEYYWAYEAERQINAGEILDWLIKVGDLARKYYQENSQFAEYHEEKEEKQKEERKREKGKREKGKRVEHFGRKSLFSREKTFKKYWYLQYSGWFFRAISIFLNSIDFIIGRSPAKPFKGLVSIFGRLIGDEIAKSFGDVVLYTTTDQKSRYYAVRRKILDGAVEKVRSLFTQVEPVEYENIIIVGHSLGSVVAYDTINRINHELNVGTMKSEDTNRKNVSSEDFAVKLKGLVTFGSPLDKIAFFLRDRAGKHQPIKEQIQDNFHSFRAKDWHPKDELYKSMKLENDIKRYLDDIVWLNFFEPNDPIAGHLDFYLVDYRLDDKLRKSDLVQEDGKRAEPDFTGNIELETNQKTPWGAHTAYWTCKEMYERIYDQIILQKTNK